MPFDPLRNPVDAANQESVRRNVLFDNLFVGTALQAALRRDGVLDPYLGGDGMVENIQYGRVQGAALPPGKSVSVTGQQLTSQVKWQEKLIAAWSPIDDWYYDDGSGQGGVINSGPARILDAYQVLLTTMVSTIDTMLEMSLYRHGQPSGSGGQTGSVLDNRIWDVNGLDEACNNGIDVSPFGNIYGLYGSAVRNGAIGPAMNSTPIWLGTSTGGTGQIDFGALTYGKAVAEVRGGNPKLGITNVFGFAAIAVALEAQRRDISNTKHDIMYTGLNFDGMDIYKDPLAPSAIAGEFISLGAVQGKAGNTSLVDGSNSSTQTGTVTTPQFYNSAGAAVTVSPTGSKQPSNTVCTVGEVLYMIDTSSVKIRPSDKPGFDYGIVQERVPFNPTAQYIIQRLATTMYIAQPFKNTLMFGFSS
jgi:hypothetical protein